MRTRKLIHNGLAAVLVALLIATPLLVSAYDWPQFDGNEQHSGNDTQESLINISNVGTLQRLFTAFLHTVADSSPVYFSNVITGSNTIDTVFVTNIAGELVAVNAHTGADIWERYVEGGSNQITSSPALDPNHTDPAHQFVYSYGHDSYVHKYNAGNGSETIGAGWPETATLKPRVEKGSAALATAVARDGTPYLYVANSGYSGDQDDYQGHVTTINLNTGTQNVFNADFSNLTIHFILNGTPGVNDCAHLQSGVWARPGVVYDPDTDKIYVSTGNGDFDGNVGGYDWGDSVFSLNPDGTGVNGKPLDSYTPADYQYLQNNDLDLGSTNPVIISMPITSTYQHVAAQGGKDGIIRLINLDAMSGPGGPGRVGNEIQSLDILTGSGILASPATWINPADQSRWLFVSSGYGLDGLQIVYTGTVPGLQERWHNNNESTSPVVANGVLFGVGYNICAYNALTGAQLWSWQLGPIHWQSPIVANGVLYFPNYGGELFAFSLPNLPTPSATPTSITTSTPTLTNTPPLSNTPTATLFPSDTPTNVPTATTTNTSTPLPSSTPTNTFTPIPLTDTPTNTPTSMPTDTPTNTPTSMPTDTPTNTPTSMPTDTPIPANTPTLATDTPAPPTNTPGNLTASPAAATDTPLLPTDTFIPPTNTIAPPTNTPAGPPNTPVMLTATPADCVNPFVDINDNVFYLAIHYLNCRRVVNGTDSTHYSPAGTSTRGQFAKVVVLGFGLQFYTPSGQPDFSDVSSSYFAWLYIESGYHAGILSGFDATNCATHGVAYPCYLPNIPITRGQLTKLVVNAAHYPLYTPSNGQTFIDVPTTNVFYASIETAANRGVVDGYPDHTFRPNADIRRDEMAQIVYKGAITPLVIGCYHSRQEIGDMDNDEQAEPMWPQNEEDYTDYEAKRRARIAELDEAIQRAPSNASLYWERGREKMNLGDWIHDGDNSEEGHRIMDQGMTDFDRALELDPKNISYLKYHANISFNGNWQRAISDYSQIIELEPDNPSHLFTRGDWYERMQQFERAISDYTALIEMLRRRPDGWEASWPNWMQEGGMKASGMMVDEMGINAPYSLADVYYQRARCDRALKQYGQAADDYTFLIERGITNLRFFSNPYVERAQCYEAMKQYDKALADYEVAEQMQPAANFAAAKAKIRQMMGDDAQAVVDYTTSIERLEQRLAEILAPPAPRPTPSHEEILANMPPLTRAAAEVDTVIVDRIQQAASRIGRAVNPLASGLQQHNLQDQMAEQYRSRAAEYAKLGQHERAAADYSRAIELAYFQKRTSDYTNRGNAYSNLQRYNEALADYNVAIEQAANPAATHQRNIAGYQRDQASRFEQMVSNREQQAAESGFGSQMVEHMKQMISHVTSQVGQHLNNMTLSDRTPQLMNAYFNRGTAYAMMKRYKDAVADFNAFIALDPDNASVYNNRGNAYRGLAQYEEALAEYNHAIQLEPNNSMFYNNRGPTYARLGRFNEAFADMRRAMELSPKNARILYNMAVVLGWAGKANEALSYLKQTFALDPSLRDYARTSDDFDSIKASGPQFAAAFHRLVSSEF